jgi:hypothetical protein
MKRLVLLLLFVAWPAHADEPTTPAPNAGPVVTLKKTIEADPGDLVEVTVESGAELVTWDSSEGLRITYPKADAAQKKVFIHSKVAGTYALVASIPNGKETRVAICIVTIGPRPPPPTPVPPGPNPPGPAPIPVPTKTLRVLFVYESSNTLTKAQSTVLNSTAIRDYLNSHCVKGDDGKTPDYRYFDKDVDVSSAGTTIKAMWDAAKPMFVNLPIVVIFDGLKGTSYPLPATEGEALKLLKQFGGP